MKARRRRPGPALPPRGMRPRLDAATRRHLGLVHIANLDALAEGNAEPQVLWDVLANALTWQHVAHQLDQGIAEMATQVGLAARLIDHFDRTGRVQVMGSDYDIAREGVLVMDELAARVDIYTAATAATLSQAEIARMQATAELENQHG